jgi:hypothetical protein
MRKLFLIPLCALALSACDRVAHNLGYDDKPAAASEPITHSADVVLPGSGQVLRAPGVTVIVSNGVVRDGIVKVLMYVQDGPVAVRDMGHNAVSCLVYDKQNRLVGADGGMLPGKMRSVILQIRLMHELTDARLNCQLGRVDTAALDTAER